MTKTESRAAFSLAGIFSLRMLGLFMIYPVFIFYARQLTHSTPLLIGIALGGYGLTQALLQIPFGLLSDRIGRKRIIAVGLVLFAIGSVVAALAGSIYGVILGRVLQGAGAVGSTILALNADLTREEQRTQAMAIIGMTIGLAFAVALVIGPFLASWIGVSGIFWFTALLALLGIAVLYGVTPEPAAARSHRDTEAVPALFKRVLGDGELRRLDFGIFALHTVLTASFIAMPHVLVKVVGLPQDSQWLFYLPVLAVSVLLMVPAIIIAEAKRQMKPVFMGAIVLLFLTQIVLLIYHTDLVELAVVLTLFFTAFNTMEASLPSLISKAAPADAKGTALGVYSSAQFFGIFVGGTIGGWVYGGAGVTGVFGFCAFVVLAWIFVAATMPAPRFARTHMVDVGALDEAEARRLAGEIEAVEGVFEAIVVPADGVAYIKFDGKVVTTEYLNRFSRRPVEDSVGAPNHGDSQWQVEGSTRRF
jgi:MFS family permease